MLSVTLILLIAASVMAVYGMDALVAGGGKKLARTRKDRRVSIRFFVGVGRWVQRTVGVDLRIKRKSVDTKLQQAGVAGQIGVRDFVALKVGATVGALCIVLFIATLAPGRLAYLFIFLTPVAAYLLPDGLLRRMSKRRREMIVGELPDFMDLLRISVEAGLPIQRSLDLASERTDGPLGRECDRMVRERRLGADFGNTLKELADRTGVLEVDRFVSAYESAERLGVTVSETLEQQARVVREARKRDVQVKAARSSPKIQLVVALVLVPAVLLLFAAAILGQLIGGSAGSAVFG